MEATGTYRVALAVALHEAGYRVAVGNPRQAHHCAQARLRRARTAARDARDLARLAAAPRPAPRAPPPAVDHAVRRRLVARDGLLALRTRARNQRHAPLQRPVVADGARQHRDATSADPDGRAAAPAAELAAALRGSVRGAAPARLASAPGIGLIAAAWLQTPPRPT